ncbi:MAG: ATP-dependent Clp protease proteolytic subunit, partial [Ignisphaera sp.]
MSPYRLLKMNLFFTISITVVLLLLSAPPYISCRDGSSKAITVRIEGVMSTIDIPTEEYIKQAIALAENRGVPLLIVVNSYGGYVDPTINIANMILEARTPVIGFVMDRAFSAASILIQPMHIVASVPYGVIGAAQPITINPVTGQY